MKICWLPHDTIGINEHDESTAKLAIKGENVDTVPSQIINESARHGEDSTNLAVNGGNVDADLTQDGGDDVEVAELAEDATYPDTDLPTSDNIIEIKNKLNPISLKESCLQCLASHTRNTQPPPLFGISVDFMAWNSSEKFNCSMVLPKFAHTVLCGFELIRPSPVIPSYNRQVILYNNVKVDSTVKEYLFKQVRNRKYKVMLDWINNDMINSWKPKPQESWQSIDPYSDLEDIGGTLSDSNENTASRESAKQSTTPLMVETSTSPYGLCKHKASKRSTNRPT